MINVEEFARLFIKEFPEYSEALDDHMNEYGEMLGHVFFGDLINEQLFRLLKNNSEEERIHALLSFIDKFYMLGNDDCKNIAVVTILEYLGDDRQVLERAFKYLNRNLVQEAILNEKSWGRY
jgi:hypothetical protein